MQTFLPYRSFEHTALVLDRQRLGKQRVEALQILRCLHGIRAGWRNHPAVKMWEGYEGALVEYGLAICDQWIDRGYQDTCRERIRCYMKRDRTRPPWLGRHRFHRSHQSNLVRKWPEYYGLVFPGVPGDLPYVWPVRREHGQKTQPTA